MKEFNNRGVCVPAKHYMVDLNSRLAQIKTMVDAGQYFNIHRPRYYGKSTIFAALNEYLRDEYVVLSLDFQEINPDSLKAEKPFVQSLCRMLLEKAGYGVAIPEEIAAQLQTFADHPVALSELFRTLKKWCASSENPIILLADGIDSATNHQPFWDFLAQLRAGYIARDAEAAPAFHSVILAGMTNICLLSTLLRPSLQDLNCIPWNIATDFNVDMSFSAEEIAGMLAEYASDHHSGMDIPAVAQEIHAQTNGHPYLMSRICQIIDREALPWSTEGVAKAVKAILKEGGRLFGEIILLLYGSPDLQDILARVLAGESLPYEPYDVFIAYAKVFGIVEPVNNRLHISNRIFEALLRRFFRAAKREEPKNAAEKRHPL